MDLGRQIFESDVVRWLLGTFGLIGAVLIIVGLIVSRVEPRIGRPILQAGGSFAGAALVLTVAGWIVA